MRSDNNGLVKVSRVVSVLGHPLLTAAIFILFVAFTRFGGAKAVVSSLIVIGLVILPITGWNYRNTRKGRYSNFDVSVRSERHSFYRMSVALLGLGTLAMWLTGQPLALRYGMAFALLLMVISSLANLFIKASLHTAVSVFLSLALLAVHAGAGAVLLGFSALVAGSRWVLKRHTLPEIGVGAAIGLVVGGSLYFFIKYPFPFL